MSTYHVSGETKGVRHIDELVDAPSAGEALRAVIDGYNGFPKRPRIVLINCFSDDGASDSGRFGIYESAGMDRISHKGDKFNVSRRRQ